jgi:nucleotide-binding universal stress UspA family protein
VSLAALRAAGLDSPGGRDQQSRSAVGDPAVALIDVAREVAADLIIVGRRGGDFVTRTLHGPVAERVVQLASRAAYWRLSGRCDVLVVA